MHPTSKGRSSSSCRGTAATVALVSPKTLSLNSRVDVDVALWLPIAQRAIRLPSHSNAVCEITLERRDPYRALPPGRTLRNGMKAR